MNTTDRAILRMFSGIVGWPTSLSFSDITAPLGHIYLFTGNETLPTIEFPIVKFIYRPDVDRQYTEPWAEVPSILVPCIEKAIVQYIGDNQYEERILFTTIKEYIQHHKNLTKLYSIARKYGVERKTRQLVSNIL